MVYLRATCGTTRQQSTPSLCCLPCPESQARPGTSRVSLCRTLPLHYNKTLGHSKPCDNVSLTGVLLFSGKKKRNSPALSNCQPSLKGSGVSEAGGVENGRTKLL